jgi:tRNA 2-selenouridine synthase
MRAAPQVELSVPLAARVAWTRQQYAHFEDPGRDAAALVALLSENRGLARFHGRGATARWAAMAAARDWDPLVRELLTEHYDPRYRKCAERDRSGPLETVEVPDTSLETFDALAGRLLAEHDPSSVVPSSSL